MQALLRNIQTGINSKHHMEETFVSFLQFLAYTSLQKQ